MKKFHTSIRSKIVSLSAASILLTILIPNTVLYLKARRIMESEYRQTARVALQQAVARVDDLMEDLDRLGRAPYLNQEALRVLGSPEDSSDVRKLLRDRRVVESFISGLYQLSNDVFAIYIFTISGESYSTDLSMFPINPDFHPLSDPLYRPVLDRGAPVTISPRRPSHSLNPTTVLSRVAPIRRLEDSSVMGLMIIDVRYDRLSSLMAGATAGNPARLYVMSDQGTVLFSRRRDDLGKDGGAILGSAEADRRHRTVSSEIVSPNTNWRFVSLAEESYLATDAGLLFRYSVAAAAMTAIAVVVAAGVLASRLTEPMRNLAATMAQVEQGSLEVRFDHNSQDEIGSLSRGFNAMMVKVRKLMGTVTSYRLATREAEIQLLLSKINPHFLYNTLQSIQMQAAIEKSQTVTRMIELLGRYLRYNLEGTADMVSLDTEMAHMEDYVDLHKIRFGGRLDYQTDVAEPCHGLTVPKLVIQPFLENAIRHGLEQRTGRCALTVSASREGDDLTLTVKDNGRGMEKEELRSVRLTMAAKTVEERVGGLTNVAHRLSLLFPGRYRLEIESMPTEGTTVTATIPVMEHSGMAEVVGAVTGEPVG